jgi:ubiquitin carboxyl-terminal hydrolase L3
MRDIGLPEPYGFAELFGMDEELLAMVPQPVDAVIAGVAVQNKAEDRAKGDLHVNHDFYMKQNSVLDNTCGVIACLHSIFNNIDEGKIQLAEGSLLAKHYANVKNLATPEEATAAL